MSTPTKEQLQALVDLWELSKRDHGGAIVVAKLLLGLYNGRRFPFDLTDLRLLDETNLQRCLLVLEMDANPAMEVHELLRHALRYPRHLGAEFEHRAYELGLKGRCKKDQLPDRQWMRERSPEGASA